MKSERRDLVWAAGAIGILIPVVCAMRATACRRIHQLNVVAIVTDGRQGSGAV